MKGGMEIPLRTGGALGLLLGAAEAANLTLEQLAGLRAPWNAIVPATGMAVMVLLFGAAATLTLRRSRSWPLALMAAVWTALVGMSLTCAYGISLSNWWSWGRAARGAWKTP